MGLDSPVKPNVCITCKYLFESLRFYMYIKQVLKKGYIQLYQQSYILLSLELYGIVYKMFEMFLLFFLIQQTTYKKLYQSIQPPYSHALLIFNSWRKRRGVRSLTSMSIYLDLIRYDFFSFDSQFLWNGRYHHISKHFCRMITRLCACTEGFVILTSKTEGAVCHV